MRNLVIVASAFIALFNIACSGGDHPAQGDEGVTVDSTEASDDDAGPTETTASSLSSECDSEHVGCPCATENAVFSCGHVKRKVNGYISCIDQFSVCENGIWSPCGGAAIK